MIQRLSGPFPVADGKIARSFALTLAQATVLRFVNVVPGGTYNLQVEVAASVAPSLTFASAVRNAPAVGGAAITEMGFICLDDGALYLSRIGAWTQ